MAHRGPVQTAARHLVLMADNPQSTGRGRFLCAIGAILAVFLAASLAAYFAGRPYIGAWASLALFVMTLSSGVLVAQGFYALEGLYEQCGRDLDAGEIAARLRAGQSAPRPFVLYLRPFASTDAMAETQTRAVRIDTGTAHLAISTNRLEFESQIEKAARAFGTMVGLGEPLEHEGAGRIEVDDTDWQALVEKLMNQARLIILLPSPTGGTRWEVSQLLASNLMTKTIVIDPPNRASDRQDYDPVDEWNHTIEIFQAEGYTLPPDAPDGQLVYFGEHRTPQDIAKLSLDDVRQMRRFMKRAVANAAAAQPR